MEEQKINLVPAAFDNTALPSLEDNEYLENPLIQNEEENHFQFSHT